CGGRRRSSSRYHASQGIWQRSHRMTKWAIFLAAPLLAQTYDIVLANGRVMDPESGLNAIRNVGIRGRTIAAISERPLQGRTTIAAKGLVVAPGFIDLHS